MFTRILMPLDGSTCAANALTVAIDLAQTQHSRLVLVNVVDPSKAALASMDPYGGTAIPWMEAMTEDGKVLLKDATAKVVAAGVAVDATHLVNGNAVDQIVALTERDGCDLIVIGSHGRSGLSRLVMGSVAEGVMREAKVPTLVVREGIKATQASAATTVLTPATA